MKVDTWQARRDDLEHRIAEKVELESKSCGGVGHRMAELAGGVIALREGMEALKPGDIEGLGRIAERWGFTFDESRDAWKEIGRSL